MLVILLLNLSVNAETPTYQALNSEYEQLVEDYFYLRKEVDVKKDDLREINRLLDVCDRLVAVIPEANQSYKNVALADLDYYLQDLDRELSELALQR